MYVTAQRVRSPQRAGINVFLYRHRGEVLHWEDPAAVVDQMPGDLRSSVVEVPHGVNQVLSFVDIVASDAIATEIVVDRVERLGDAVLSAGVAAAEGVGVRFSVTGEGTARSRREWKELSFKALDLLIRPVPLVWQSAEGLIIRQQRHEDGLVFSLGAIGVTKLREFLGPNWNPRSVSVSHVARGHLDRLGFDAYEQIAGAIAGYNLTELLSLGRVRVEGPEGQLVWQWPAAQGLGYCLTCHRQHTLVETPSGCRCTNCDALRPGDGRFVGAST